MAFTLSRRRVLTTLGALGGSGMVATPAQAQPQMGEGPTDRFFRDDWLGEPLSMNLHHVNGDGDDNRLENLMLLCPNCHSQTANFAGRRRSVAA